MLQSKNCESYRIFAYFCGIKFIKLDVREDLELVERLVAFFYQIWRAQNGAALHYENEFHRAKFEPISDCIDKHVGPIQHEHFFGILHLCDPFPPIHRGFDGFDGTTPQSFFLELVCPCCFGGTVLAKRAQRGPGGGYQP